MNNKTKIMGIDLGGTNVRAGIVNKNKLINFNSIRIHSEGSVSQVMEDLFEVVDRSINPSVEAIGIGVPGVVDVEEGIVYNALNIPSWKIVHLRQRMEDRYHRPVLVNNDANCFALGEKYFGKGMDDDSIVGLIIGTGMAAGIIINNRLYEGSNCGAGEFGMVDYLDQHYEYYASGQYFENEYHTKGEEIFQKAQHGDKTAIDIFDKLGMHIGNAIKMILYTYDPKRIILGGSVSQAYSYFQRKMWEHIRTFAYPKSLDELRLEISELDNCGIFGAAALYYDDSKK